MIRVVFITLLDRFLFFLLIFKNEMLPFLFTKRKKQWSRALGSWLGTQWYRYLLHNLHHFLTVHLWYFSFTCAQVSSREEVSEVSQARFWELVPGHVIGSISLQVITKLYCVPLPWWVVFKIHIACFMLICKICIASLLPRFTL